MSDIYRAIVALADLVNNPEALRQASDQLCTPLALSEAEIKKRDEYNELLVEEKALSLALDARQKKLDALESEYAIKASALDADKKKFDDEVSAWNLLVTKRETAISDKERNIAQKELFNNNRSLDLDNREADLNKVEIDINRRIAEVILREDKVNRVLEAAK